MNIDDSCLKKETSVHPSGSMKCIHGNLLLVSCEQQQISSINSEKSNQRNSSHGIYRFQPENMKDNQLFTIKNIINWITPS